LEQFELEPSLMFLDWRFSLT